MMDGHRERGTELRGYIVDSQRSNEFWSGPNRLGTDKQFLDRHTKGDGFPEQ